MLNPVSYYRLARWFHLRRIPLMPRLIERLSVLLFHCYIPSSVEIGKGFAVGYWGMGVVIHPRVKIGQNVFVAHGVTIGGRNELPQVPKIEDNVYIATGAKVLGDVTIGNGSVIGANAVVLRSVPPRCIAVGVPASISRKNINVHDYTGWPKPPAADNGASTAAGPVSIDGPGLRILHMVNSLEMGGSEHQMVEVARRQKANGYRVIVGCLSAKGCLLDVLREAGITVFEFNPNGSLYGPGGVYQLLRLTWFMFCKRFDVVQTHELYSTLLGVPAAWLCRIPVILSSRRDLAHWSWYTPRHRMLLRRIQSLSTFVIANSQAVKDFLVQEDRFDPSLIRIVRNGVDFERFATTPRDRSTLFRHLHPEAKLIAVVANMNVETKGHTDLLRAAVDVSRDCPQVMFVLIGDGPERPRIEDIAEELGLRENVLFLGRRNDVADVLACCDLFVLPSWAEGLPNSVLEAMAAALPVVATHVGGTPEILEDKSSGLLVAPHDAHALARQILRILQDPELAHGLALAAQERARRMFSFGRLLMELDNLYVEGRLSRGRVRKPAGLEAGKGAQGGPTPMHDANCRTGGSFAAGDRSKLTLKEP